MDIVIFAVGLVAGFIMGFVPTWVGQYIYRKNLEALGDGGKKDEYKRIVMDEAEDPDDQAEREKKEQENIGFW